MNKGLSIEECLAYIDELDNRRDTASETDVFSNDEDGDISDAASEHSDHDTDSEIDANEGSDEETEDPDKQGNHNYLYGRNRYKWSTQPPATCRTRKHNIITHLPGLKGPALNNKPTQPVEAWNLLFTEGMLQNILESTNEKITELSANYGPTCTYVNHLSHTELRAFLGLLLLSGIMKSNHEDVDSLFATDGTGREIFRATMSKERFLFLLLAIRFDDSATRDQRKESGDRLAAISDIFNEFIKNSISNYTCSEFATVDEMLVGFRGRCLFRVYLSSKPKKYGIKIMCLCDAKTHYLVNAFVYTGKDNSPNTNKLSVPTRSVISLVEPIAGTNRNVTGDNWFTSIELVDELKSMSLTYVGTMRKNKREIPPSFLPSKKKQVGESHFGFTRDKTIVSYVPKKNKSVVLISSMHHDKSVNGTNGKPEIIDFYNSSKGGVDALDQKCALYEVGRRCRRWPLVIFYALLNISCVNSHVIFLAANNDARMRRRDFIKNIGMTLILDHMKIRAQIETLPKELRLSISRLTGTPLQIKPTLEIPSKRRRCCICPRSDDKKHAGFCSQCLRNVCKSHSTVKVLCNECQ